MGGCHNRPHASRLGWRHWRPRAGGTSRGPQRVTGGECRGARGERGYRCTPSLPLYSRLLPFGAEATGPPDNALLPPPPAQAPPMGPRRRRAGALHSATALPSPSQARPARAGLLMPCPRATPSKRNFRQSALRSRAETFSGAGRLTSVGLRSPAKAASSSSCGEGGGGAIPARPGDGPSPRRSAR